LQANGIGPSLAPLFDTISNPSDRRDDLVVVAASVLGLMLQPGFVFDAGEAFMATVYLIQLLNGHVLGETAAGPVLEYFVSVWRDILAKRSFSVRNLAATGPLILAAPSKGESNKAKLAHLVLASEPAVHGHLSDEFLVAVSSQKRIQRTPDLAAPAISAIPPCNDGTLARPEYPPRSRTANEDCFVSKVHILPLERESFSTSLARKVRTDQAHSRGPGSKKSSGRCSCVFS